MQTTSWKILKKKVQIIRETIIETNKIKIKTPPVWNMNKYKKLKQKKIILKILMLLI